MADGFDEAGILGTASIPCQGAGEGSCPTILRSCNVVKGQTITSVAWRYFAKINGIYAGKVLSLFGQNPLGDPAVPGTPGEEEPQAWLTPVCDLLNGEGENDSDSSCGLYAFSRFRITERPHVEAVLDLPPWEVTGGKGEVTSYCQVCDQHEFPSGTPRGEREVAWIRGALARAYKCSYEQVTDEFNAGSFRLTAESCKLISDQVASQYKSVQDAVFTHLDGTTSSDQSLCGQEGAGLTNACAADSKIEEGASPSNLMIDVDSADGMRQKICYLGGYRQGIESQLGYLLMCEITNRAEMFYNAFLTPGVWAMIDEIQTRAQSECEGRARGACKEPEVIEVGEAWVSGHLDDLVALKEQCVNDEINRCYPEIAKPIIKDKLDKLFQKYFPGGNCPMPPGPTSWAPAPRAALPITAAAPVWLLIAFLFSLAAATSQSTGCSAGVAPNGGGQSGPSGPSGGSGSTGPSGPPPPPVDPPPVPDTSDLQDLNKKQAEVNETSSQLAGLLPVDEGGATNVVDGSAVHAGATAIQDGQGIIAPKGEGDASRNHDSERDTGSSAGGGGGGALARGPSSSGLGDVSTKPAETGPTGPEDADQDVEDAIYQGGGGAGYAARGAGGGETVTVEAGTGGDMDFGAAGQGTEGDVDPMLGDDPKNYFGMIGSLESLFERVTRRYERKQLQWEIASAESKLKASEKKARRRN